MAEMRKRESSGAVVRTLVDVLDKRGLKARVREVVTPAARELMDKPPLHIGWAPGELSDAIFLGVAQVEGVQALRDVTYDLTRSAGVAPLVVPLLKTFLGLFGGTPASLFRNVDRIIHMVVRGPAFAWTAEGDTAGVVTVTYPEKVPPELFASWEGAFRFAGDVAGRPVTVEPAVVGPDGMSARIRTSW